MATNDITLYIPPTEEEVMLIQPNNVTFGQYSVTEWQENLLTLISDQIQQHMTREKQLPKDLFNQPVVEIKCDEAGGKNNKSKVLKEAIAMMRKNFSFRWVHPNIHQTVETFGVVITTVHNIKGTNRVALTLNPWAIPFLLYYGTGVGGTRYGKNIALTLRGNYTKRLYKIICSQRDRREYYYSIDQFCKDLEIPASYSNAQIDQKVLRPAQTRIKESEADVWFDYKFICKTPKKGAKTESRHDYPVHPCEKSPRTTRRPATTILVRLPLGLRCFKLSERQHPGKGTRQDPGKRTAERRVRPLCILRR